MGRGGVDFYQVVDQVVELLRYRGRVSYRALQRQFGLDDAYLEDLGQNSLSPNALQWMSTDRSWYGREGATSTLPLQAVSATPPIPRSE